MAQETMFKKQIANKEQIKLMLGLTGPSGAGKTYSALHLAYGITGDWSKIALADTENRSALYYAGSKTGDWWHIPFSSKLSGGYHPANWIRLIEETEQDPKIEVLILDSISHEWDGVGGCLDLNAQFGGRYTDWAKVTPHHNAFIDKMRESRLHIIATMRSVQDYALGTTEKGKPKPEKVGMKSKQREGTDYEFGIIFDITMSHYATSSKDRSGLFANKPDFKIGVDTGKELLAWAKEGEVTAHSPKPIVLFDKEDKEHLERLDAYLKNTDLLNKNSFGLEEKVIICDLLNGKVVSSKAISEIIVHIKETKEAATKAAEAKDNMIEELQGDYQKDAEQF